METPQVYAAIAAVVSDMAREGISKDSTNEQQRYRFRGIDAVYNALAPKLAAHGLCILPRVIAKEATERETKNGGVLFYTRLTVEFDLVSVKDGSKHTICTVGEAMDSGDKSSNKAMSAAYKYAAFMAFCIPTEGDNDADSTTHEVQARGAAYTAPAPRAIELREQTHNGANLKQADWETRQTDAPICDVCGTVGRKSKKGSGHYCPNKSAHDGTWYTIPEAVDTSEWEEIDSPPAPQTDDLL